MSDSRSLATITVFTALIVGSDFVLAGIPNVKLVDTLVFVSAYLYGFRVGASVAVLSEFLWSYLSPWGMPGYIAPFLVAGEVVFAFGGYAASKLWKEKDGLPMGKSVFIGGALALGAFLWDIETNVATALIAFWPAVSPANVMVTILYGVPFMLSHEVSDFVFGMLFAPVIIFLIPRFLQRAHPVSLGPVRAEDRK